MNLSPERLATVCIGVLLGLLAASSGTAAEADVELTNPSFEKGTGPNGVPVGWHLYKRITPDLRVDMVDTAATGRAAVLLHDSDATEEVGIVQKVPVEPGAVYEASVSVRRVPGAPCAGAYLQLLFIPPGKLYQVGLAATSESAFNRVRVAGTAPENTTHALIYLYTHHRPMPRVIVDDVCLVRGVELPAPAPGSVPSANQARHESLPVPEPIPPVYETLKELHLTVPLVSGGRAMVSVITPASGVYDRDAAAIQQSIKRMTGVTVPIVADSDIDAGAPIKSNLIVLGNRSTNRTICALYDGWYTMLDLKYPGRHGHVVRTLHNPYGNGHSAVLVGGSDATGVRAAAQALIETLDGAGPSAGQLSLGWTMDIKLGDGLEPVAKVADYEDVKHWDASPGYKSGFCFGWAMHSKLMAMYYMTGEEAWLREFKRVAFPDAEAAAYIRQHEAYGFNDFRNPLSKPYHYSGFTMVLLWDLVEESPLFSDAERLRITNAFAKQLAHWAGERAYECKRPPSGIMSRHGQWSSLCMYVLGRYFEKYYPDPRWRQAMSGPSNLFRFLHPPINAVVSNESSFWLATLIQPVFTWITLSGDRTAVASGHLGRLLGHLELLSTGEDRCWVSRWSALSMLNRAAYLLNDGRWAFYRDRLGMDTDGFRVGHSFWPEPGLRPEAPANLPGKWCLYQPTEQIWASRANRLPLSQSFFNASYRSATDASGDFILLDGCYAGAGRGGIHSYATQKLRLNGCQLLDGHGNQVLTGSDGMMEPGVAKDGALVYTAVIGDTVVAIGGSPHAAYCNWQRSIVLRTCRYALVVDDLTFRTDSENMDVQVRWETSPAVRPSVLGPGVLQLQVSGQRVARPGWTDVRAASAPCTTNATGEERIAALDSLGIMLLIAAQPGVWIELPFSLGERVTGDVTVDFLKYKDRGVVRILLDGAPVGATHDLYAASAVPHTVSLGRRELAAGEHRLRVETVAVNPETEKCYVGLGGVSVRTEGADADVRPPGYDVCSADAMPTTTDGRRFAMKWTGRSTKGAHRVFSSLIGRNPRDPAVAPSCARVSPNAAALALPEPAMCIVGSHECTLAELAVVAADHLFGRALERAGLSEELLGADAPVDVDWCFATGALHVVAEKESGLVFAADAARPFTVDGNAQGHGRVTLTPGKHTIRNVYPDPAVRKRLTEQLRRSLQSAQQQRCQAAASVDKPTAPSALPELAPSMSVELGGKVSALEIVPSGPGTLVCAAVGRTVLVLTGQGARVTTLTVDAPVRVMRWWQEHELLLVGCADKRVLAFDRQWHRTWTFTATVAPEIANSNQQGWASHPGIFGLHSDVFIGGKSQAFVGSACTIEIIDEQGTLIKNIAAPWGDTFLFTVIDGADGSRELLAARWPNGYDSLHIINSTSLKRRSGFRSVPPGHTVFSPWTGVNRVRIFWEDLDGDGTNELASATNGDWNRVSIWSGDSKPLYNAQLGPGTKGPGSTIADMDVADLDRDGRKEILVARTDGTLLVLDHTCEKVWARRLPFPLRLLRCVGRGTGVLRRIVVAGGDGTVLILDNAGTPLCAGDLSGRPDHIVVSHDAGRPVVYMASHKGQLKGFPVAGD